MFGSTLKSQYLSEAFENFAFKDRMWWSGEYEISADGWVGDKEEKWYDN